MPDWCSYYHCRMAPGLNAKNCATMNFIFFKTNKTPVAIANIFCVGRNYAAHAAEMNSPTLDLPMIFLKPSSAVATEKKPIQLPTFSQDVHYETELVILIGKGGVAITQENAWDYIAGYGIGLDLTARDIQAEAKKKGHPWTLAKGFIGAACVSQFVAANELKNPSDCHFTLLHNGELKQSGETRLMLFSIPYLISYISSVFGLTEGDLIFTGTPEGVGKLNSGDKLQLNLADSLTAEFTVK